MTPQELVAWAWGSAFKSDPPDTTAERFINGPRETFGPGELVCERAFRSERYLRQCAIADWRSVPPEVRAVAGDLLLRAKKVGVPLFVAAAHGGTLRFAHSRYLAMLSAQETAWLEWIGRASLARFGLPGRFDRTRLVCPVDPLEESGDGPLALTPLVLSRYRSVFGG